jgi:hypothetical protein
VPPPARRLALVEHCASALAAAAALQAANAPLSAARALDRQHPHVTEAMAWALEGPSPLAARAYSGVAWAAMPVLAPRLDLAQRQAFCKAKP